MTFLALVRAKSTAATNSTFLEHLESPAPGGGGGTIKYYQELQTNDSSAILTANTSGALTANLNTPTLTTSTDGNKTIHK